MKITFYTNAMVLMESAHSRVLCDPWVTFNDYSESGFFNFPRCQLSPEAVAAIKPDFIYITHTHPDHFDPITLELFDKTTPMIVSYYALNFTEKNIRALGFTDVRVSDPKEGLALNGNDHCWIEPAAYSPEVDSIAVFRLDDKTIINANDNTFNQEQCLSLKKRYGPLDVGLIPSGAHGPWPMFFDNYSSEEKAKAAAHRRQQQKEAFKNYITALEPHWVIPFAGGIICCGEKAKQYPFSGINPRSEVVTYAQQFCDFEPIFLSEGNSFDFATMRREGDYIEQTFATEQNYIQDLEKVPSLFSQGGKFFVRESEQIDLSRLLKLARQTQSRWQQKMEITNNISYYFDTGDEKLYRLSLSDVEVSRVTESDIKDSRYEIFRLPYELLLGLLTRHYVWSNTNTQHMTFHRQGGDMDKDLMVLLNYLQV